MDEHDFQQILRNVLEKYQPTDWEGEEDSRLLWEPHLPWFVRKLTDASADPMREKDTLFYLLAALAFRIELWNTETAQTFFDQVDAVSSTIVRRYVPEKSLLSYILKSVQEEESHSFISRLVRQRVNLVDLIESPYVWCDGEFLHENECPKAKNKGRAVRGQCVVRTSDGVVLKDLGVTTKRDCTVWGTEQDWTPLNNNPVSFRFFAHFVLTYLDIFRGLETLADIPTLPFGVAESFVNHLHSVIQRYKEFRSVLSDIVNGDDVSVPTEYIGNLLYLAGGLVYLGSQLLTKQGTLYHHLLQLASQVPGGQVLQSTLNKLLSTSQDFWAYVHAIELTLNRLGLSLQGTFLYELQHHGQNPTRARATFVEVLYAFDPFFWSQLYQDTDNVLSVLFALDPSTTLLNVTLRPFVQEERYVSCAYDSKPSQVLTLSDCRFRGGHVENTTNLSFVHYLEWLYFVLRSVNEQVPSSGFTYDVQTLEKVLETGHLTFEQLDQLLGAFAVLYTTEDLQIQAVRDPELKVSLVAAFEELRDWFSASFHVATSALTTKVTLSSLFRGPSNEPV